MMMMVVESNKKHIFKRVFSEDHLSHFPTLSAKFIKKESGFQLGILYFFILNLENLVLISLPSHSREKGQKKKTKFFLF